MKYLTIILFAIYSQSAFAQGNTKEELAAQCNAFHAMYYVMLNEEGKTNDANFSLNVSMNLIKKYRTSNFDKLTRHYNNMLQDAIGRAKKNNRQSHQEFYNMMNVMESSCLQIGFPEGK